MVAGDGPNRFGQGPRRFMLVDMLNDRPAQHRLTVETRLNIRWDGVGQMQVNAKTISALPEGCAPFYGKDRCDYVSARIRLTAAAQIAWNPAMDRASGYLNLDHQHRPSVAVSRLVRMGRRNAFLLAPCCGGLIAQRLGGAIAPTGSGRPRAYAGRKRSFCGA